MFDIPDPTDEQLAALPAKERKIWEQVKQGRGEQAAEVERLASQREWVKALAYIDSKERAARLAEWDAEYGLDAVEAYVVIEHCWSITEAWSGDTFLRDFMLGLLKRAGVVVVTADGAKDERAEVLAMLRGSDRIKVWRGNLGEAPRGGGSWTLARATAERFAAMANSPRGMFLGMYRKGGVPSIWSATVPPADILGYFNDRGEREVVLDDSADLQDLSLVAQAE